MMREERSVCVEGKASQLSAFEHQSRGRARMDTLIDDLILEISAMSATIISVSSPADFHVHLRQGDLSQLVTPHVRQGGFRLAYVMVNIAYENHIVLDLRCLTSPISRRPSPLRIKHWNTKLLSRKSTHRQSF